MTATLYRRTESGWERQVLRGVFGRWSAGQTQAPGFARTDDAESWLLIPWGTGEPPRPGDGICPGEGPDMENAPLKTQLPWAQTITRVDCFRAGSGLDHWEVTAR